MKKQMLTAIGTQENCMILEQRNSLLSQNILRREALLSITR